MKKFIIKYVILCFDYDLNTFQCTETNGRSCLLRLCLFALLSLSQPDDEFNMSFHSLHSFRAQDIADLQIIRSREEADDIVNLQTVPMVLSEETKKAVLPKCPSPVKIVHAASIPTVVVGNGNNVGVGKHFTGNFTSRVSPAKFRADNGSGRNSKQGRSSPPGERNNTQSPEKEFRSRKNSGALSFILFCFIHN